MDPSDRRVPQTAGYFRFFRPARTRPGTPEKTPRRDSLHLLCRIGRPPVQRTEPGPRLLPAGIPLPQYRRGGGRGADRRRTDRARGRGGGASRPRRADAVHRLAGTAELGQPDRRSPLRRTGLAVPVSGNRRRRFTPCRHGMPHAGHGRGKPLGPLPSDKRRQAHADGRAGISPRTRAADGEKLPL